MGNSRTGTDQKGCYNNGRCSGSENPLSNFIIKFVQLCVNLFFNRTQLVSEF